MKNKPRIAVITKYFSPVTAGIETNIQETYRELAHMGWDVTIYTSRDTLSQKNVLPEKEVVMGLKVVRLSHLRFPLLLQVPGVADLLCLHNFNVFPHALLYLSIWLRRLMGMPTPGVFMTPHGGYTPEWPTFSSPVRLLKKYYHAGLGKFFLNTLTGQIRAISTWEHDELVRCGIQKSSLVTIPNGLSSEALSGSTRAITPAVRQLVEQSGDYLLAIGRLAPIKNYHTVLRALALVKSPSLKLLIIGPIEDRDYLRYLEHLAKSLGLSDRLVLGGVVRGADKYYLIRHARAFLHLSRWESFCNSAYESMSQKTLTIVADNTALSSLVQDGVTGIKVKTFDYQALAKVLSSLSSPQGKKLVSQIKTNLAKTHFNSWSDTAKLMGSAYQKLLRSYVQK